MKWIKPLVSAAAALLVLLNAAMGAALAWEEDEIVGNVSAITVSNTQNGSLTDDSPLGSAAADAAVYACGADFAVLCGGDFAGNLAPGPLTWGQLQFAFRQDAPLVLCEVTAGQLKTLLEFCLSRMTVDEKTLLIDREASAFDAFPQISGFTLRYDVSAPVGSRVLEMTADGGEQLDSEDTRRVYRIVCTERLLSGGFGSLPEDYSYDSTGVTVCQALGRYIADGRMRDYTDEKRIVCIGSADNTLIRQLGLQGILLPACILAALILAGWYRVKSSHVQPDRPESP